MKCVNHIEYGKQAYTHFFYFFLGEEYKLLFKKSKKHVLNVNKSLAQLTLDGLRTKKSRVQILRPKVY